MCLLLHFTTLDAQDMLPPLVALHHCAPSSVCWCALTEPSSCAPRRIWNQSSWTTSCWSRRQCLHARPRRSLPMPKLPSPRPTRPCPACPRHGQRKQPGLQRPRRKRSWRPWRRRWLSEHIAGIHTTAMTAIEACLASAHKCCFGYPPKHEDRGCGTSLMKASWRGSAGPHMACGTSSYTATCSYYTMKSASQSLSLGNALSWAQAYGCLKAKRLQQTSGHWQCTSRYLLRRIRRRWASAAQLWQFPMVGRRTVRIAAGCNGPTGQTSGVDLRIALQVACKKISSPKQCLATGGPP